MSRSSSFHPPELLGRSQRWTAIAYEPLRYILNTFLIDVCQEEKLYTRHFVRIFDLLT